MSCIITKTIGLRANFLRLSALLCWYFAWSISGNRSTDSSPTERSKQAAIERAAQFQIGNGKVEMIDHNHSPLSRIRQKRKHPRQQRCLTGLIADGEPLPIVRSANVSEDSARILMKMQERLSAAIEYAGPSLLNARFSPDLVEQISNRKQSLFRCVLHLQPLRRLLEKREKTRRPRDDMMVLQIAS